jgi:GT2 family glycosyltransferase
MSKEIAPASEPAKERQTSRKRLRQAEPKPDSAAVPIEYAFEDEFEDEFDEQAYLRQHPEVAAAISEGHLPNALFHFRVFSTKPRPATATAQRAMSPQQNGAAAAQPEAVRPKAPNQPVGQEPTQPREPVRLPPQNFGPGSVDAVVISQTGAMFVIGWAADREAPLQRISVQIEDGRSREWPAPQLIRFRRTDAEKALGLGPTRGLGFCGLLFGDAKANGGRAKSCAVKLSAGDGSSAEFPVMPRLVSDVELRELMLGYLSSVEFMGNNQVEAFFRLDGYLGDALIRHSRTITRSIVGGASLERFETAPGHFKGSIVVCLYGKAEFQFVQNALFAAGAGARDYEYIYVSNSPELIEQLHKIAAIAQRIYDLPISIVALPGNAGFGAANNAAARYANSDRIILLNPDVLPMDSDWSAAHSRILAERPADETRLFGSRLFYADGSLMHAGMYVDVDWGISAADFEIRRRPMLRVEHYGKGAPKDAEMFRGSRPVSAVSGAFMSMDRDWFERIGGFAEDYIFAYYEDADLCLRSWDRGSPAWVHELDFWHLEGKGASTPLPHHKGAATVNRWQFTREWHDRVAAELLGRVTPSAPSKLRAVS